jgi:hypothetical protein
MSVIKVQFDDNGRGDGRHYAYFCDYPVEVGDRVIVESPFNGYVVGTAGFDSIKATKEVVCLIDDKRYQARKAAKARMAELGAEIERRARERAIAKGLKKLLKGDKEGQKMLEELEDLGQILNNSPEMLLEEANERMGKTLSVIPPKAPMTVRYPSHTAASDEEEF